jgi:hypothetical protein
MVLQCGSKALSRELVTISSTVGGLGGSQVSVRNPDKAGECYAGVLEHSVRGAR